MRRVAGDCIAERAERNGPGAVVLLVEYVVAPERGLPPLTRRRIGEVEVDDREVRVMSIGGGSEEILLDLAGRQLGYG